MNIENFNFTAFFVVLFCGWLGIEVAEAAISFAKKQSSRKAMLFRGLFQNIFGFAGMIFSRFYLVKFEIFPKWVSVVVFFLTGIVWILGMLQMWASIFLMEE